ncbi:MAG TPA: hypothetical protein VFY79_13750 [Dehalococcoidia bacterium]|nr:hypothetical protein [Dehalococcoidia bacterium]
MARFLRYAVPVIAVAALGISIAALVIVLTRPDRTEPGRRIDVGASSDFAVDRPVFIEKDHLYIVKAGNGDGSATIHAFYSVVPGFFGLENGCEVRWHPDQTATDNEGTVYHGIFSDGCGGSKFTIDGKRLFGPAPGDLDQFWVDYAPTGHDHIIVDTRLLMCSVTPQHPEVLNSCHRTLADN